jgi:hypothetical protein
MMCRYIDEGVVGCGMGAFPDWGPLAKDSATKLNRGPAKCVYCVCVRCTFPPVWMKFMPGWPAISVSS